MAILVIACQQKNELPIIGDEVDSNSQISAEYSVPVSIPSLPLNWEYQSCSYYKADCDFDLPLPESNSMDAQNVDTSRNFWLSGPTIPFVYFRDIGWLYDQKDIEKTDRVTLQHFSIEELAQKNDLYTVYNKLPIKEGLPAPVIQFLYSGENYTLVKRKIGDFYDYVLRTPKYTFHIIDPGIYGKSPAIITDANISLLETVLLNIRAK